MVDWFVKKGMHQFVATFWETTGFGIFLRDFCDFHLSLGVWLAQIWRDLPQIHPDITKNPWIIWEHPRKSREKHEQNIIFPVNVLDFVPQNAPSAPASARDQWPWQWLQIPKASPGFRKVVSCGWTILIGHPKWIAPVLRWDIWYWGYCRTMIAPYVSLHILHQWMHAHGLFARWYIPLLEHHQKAVTSDCGMGIVHIQLMANVDTRFLDGCGNPYLQPLPRVLADAQLKSGSNFKIPLISVAQKSDDL